MKEVGEMSEHTRGPWKIFEGWGSSKVAPVIVDSIPDIDGKFVGNCICHMASTNADVVANSRLIAAAPDLLAALEKIVGECRVFCEDSMDIDHYAVEQAREAIKYAKGAD
jgi:hypothetical protein